VEILRNAICYIESLEELLASADIRFPSGAGGRRGQEQKAQVGYNWSRRPLRQEQRPQVQYTLLVLIRRVTGTEQEEQELPRPGTEAMCIVEVE
jgi:hypothetical protein